MTSSWRSRLGILALLSVAAILFAASTVLLFRGVAYERPQFLAMGPVGCGSPITAFGRHGPKCKDLLEPRFWRGAWLAGGGMLFLVAALRLAYSSHKATSGHRA